MIEESRVLELMCQVKNFTVDYETNTVTVNVPELHCADMGRTIELFTLLNPEVKRIEFFQENEPNSAQHERQRGRRMLDKKGIDKNKNGKADARESKDIDHKKPIRQGGKSTMSNIRLRSKRANQSDNGK
jgi:hypothetical protein